MSERGEQIQKLLATLSKHGDLVAEAFDGTVHTGDKPHNSRIEALFAVGALKAFDEGSYRLNPRLREFLADHFAVYHAMQSLRMVGGTLRQAKKQWDELTTLHSNGVYRDAERLYAALEESVVDMSYSIEHNLDMLHALISTQYGNVDNLQSKLRQNTYYANQVKVFLKDVQNIDAFVEETAEEAIVAGIPAVRRLVMRRLGARCLNWTAQIKDAQAVISKRLFEAQLMEARVKRLARFALWLTRHQTSDGWDVAVEEDADVALFRPQPIAIRPHPDITDIDPVAQEGLLAAVEKLPPAKEMRQPEQDAGPQMMIQDDDSLPLAMLDPDRRAIMELLDMVKGSAEPVSILEWKRGRQDLSHISDGAWLFYSSMQLKGTGRVRVQFEESPRTEAFPLNETFYDVHALRMGRDA